MTTTPRIIENTVATNAIAKATPVGAPKRLATDWPEPGVSPGPASTASDSIMPPMSVNRRTASRMAEGPPAVRSGAEVVAVSVPRTLHSGWHGHGRVRQSRLGDARAGSTSRSDPRVAVQRCLSHHQQQGPSGGHGQGHSGPQQAWDIGTSFARTNCVSPPAPSDVSTTASCRSSSSSSARWRAIIRRWSATRTARSCVMASHCPDMQSDARRPASTGSRPSRRKLTTIRNRHRSFSLYSRYPLSRRLAAGSTPRRS